MPQANLTVLKELPSDKEKQIRQDRYEIVEENCRLTIDSATYEVANYSSFGIAIYGDQGLKPGPSEIQGVLYFQQTKIGSYTLKHVRSEEISLNYVKHAFEIVGSPIPLEKIRAISIANAVVQKQSESFAQISSIHPEFKRHIYEMKAKLIFLKEEIGELEEKSSFIDRTSMDDFEVTVADVISNFLTDLFQPFYQRIVQILSSMNQEDHRRHIHFFRGELKNIISLAPFASLSLEKKRGYPGDFDIMNVMYSDQAVGKNLFAMCLNKYFMKHPNAIAVRNRVRYLHEKILETILSNQEPIKILSIACGPAREIIHLLEFLPKNTRYPHVEIHLLDQDADSLKNAQMNIREQMRISGIDITVRYFNKAIRNLIREGMADKYDLMYSAGLFDYFSDPVAEISALKFYSCLKNRGLLIIGNFNSMSSNEMLMTVVLDWRLIYRNKDDLIRLYQSIPGKHVVESEEEGINLFMNITRNDC